MRLSTVWILIATRTRSPICLLGLPIETVHLIALLNTALGTGPAADWLLPALSSEYQTLRTALDQYTAVSAEAGQFSGNVEGWLRLLGYVGDIAAKARQLRGAAADTLIHKGNTKGAEQILKQIEPPALLRLGRLREMQGRLEEASKAFEQAGSTEDVKRIEIAKLAQAPSWEDEAKENGDAKADRGQYQEAIADFSREIVKRKLGW